jgi:hypothetical protein
MIIATLLLNFAPLITLYLKTQTTLAKVGKELEPNATRTTTCAPQITVMMN